MQCPGPDPLEKTAPGDDVSLSNSNCLERLREFYRKSIQGMRGGREGGQFALNIKYPACR